MDGLFELGARRGHDDREATAADRLERRSESPCNHAHPRDGLEIRIPCIELEAETGVPFSRHFERNAAGARRVESFASEGNDEPAQPEGVLLDLARERVEGYIQNLKISSLLCSDLYIS